MISNRQRKREREKEIERERKIVCHVFVKIVILKNKKGAFFQRPFDTSPSKSSLKRAGASGSSRSSSVLMSSISLWVMRRISKWLREGMYKILRHCMTSMPMAKNMERSWKLQAHETEREMT